MSALWSGRLGGSFQRHGGLKHAVVERVGRGFYIIDVVLMLRREEIQWIDDVAVIPRLSVKIQTLPQITTKADILDIFR